MMVGATAKNEDGNPAYHSADVEPVMLADSRRIVKELAQCGVSAIFHDDDLRMGNWGPQMEGCFCDECIAVFNASTGRHETRQSLKVGLKEGKDLSLRIDWAADLCRKLGTLVDALTVPGIRNGAMIMASGDERHGIDLSALSAAHPDLMFRVGEAHFSDADYATPYYRACEWVSVMQHLSLMQGHETYSETTVFPPRALAPENLLGKARLALAAGVDNIFYMSGTWIPTNDYWDALTRGLSGLKDLSASMGQSRRVYPVHVANGTSGGLGERLQPPVLPFLSGIPCRPVRGGDKDPAADVLLFFGDYKVTPQWEAKFPGYQAVIFDEAACAANPEYAARHSASIFRAPFTAGDDITHSEELRKIVRETAPDPMPMAAGAAAIPVWLADGQVMVFSLENHPAEVSLTYGDHTAHTLRLSPAGSGGKIAS